MNSHLNPKASVGYIYILTQGLTHKTQLLFIVCFCLLFSNYASAQSTWTISKTSNTKHLKSQSGTLISIDDRLMPNAQFLKVKLNINAALETLKKANSELANKKGDRLLFHLPNLDGKMTAFYIEESSNMHPDLQAKYPYIRSYTGVSLDDPLQTVRFSLNQQGIDAYVRTVGKETLRISHGSFKGEEEHLVYLESSARDMNQRGACGSAHHAKPSISTQSKELKLAYECELIIFDLAMAMTPTLTNTLTDLNGNGLTDEGLAMINNKVTMMNDHFGRELSVRFQLIPNTDDLIFSDTSLPFYRESGSDPTARLIAENQDVIDEEIGENNYDIGHLLWLGPASGVIGRATLGTVCDDGRKARGVSNISDATILHELGHQFDAQHTFGTGCDDDNINESTAFEIGCGRTIMSYSGSPFLNFHAYSLAEMKNFIKYLGSSCTSNSAVVNTAPTIGPQGTIFTPISTPIILETNASDPTGDMLSYSWDQIDAENGIFESLPPSQSNKRYIPNLESIRTNTPNPNEAIPNSSKTVDFFSVVRDNHPSGGCIDMSWRRVEFTNAAGPFRMTSFNAPGQSWPIATNHTLSWDVADTNLSPISCSHVEVWFSFDNGLSFPYLVKTTPNDGNTNLFIDPCLPNTTGLRIMIKAQNGIFFDMNDEPIEITNGLMVSNWGDAGFGTLREAIRCANEMPGRQYIQFTPGMHGKTLTLNSLLPIVTEPIHIDASNVDFTIDANGLNSGLRLRGAPPTGSTEGHKIQGLKIQNFTGLGIDISGSYANIGGSFALRNEIVNDYGGVGIYLNYATKCQVGYNSIVNNGSGAYGISLVNSSSNTLHYNYIEGYNYGVSLAPSTSFNYLFNSIYCSMTKGIRIESGGNGDLAAPTILNRDDLGISGTAGPSQQIDVFATKEDCMGSCDGYLYVGTTVSASDGSWELLRADYDAVGFNCLPIVATATALFGYTSEYSNCYINSYCVTNDNDNGVGSLRAAITAANTSSDLNRITFLLPSGTTTISPLSQLPALNGNVAINGLNRGQAIIIDGQFLNSGEHGLVINGSIVEVRAMKIQNFPGSGIHVTGTSSSVIIGDRWDPNYIFNNGVYGIGLSPTTQQQNISIENNYIGTNFNDDVLGNGAAGIRIANGKNINIEDNRIAYNGGNGIHITETINLDTDANIIYCNDGFYKIYDLIDIFSGPYVDPPSITSFTSAGIAGLGIPGAEIQVFSLPLDKCTEGCSSGGNELIEHNIIVPSNGKWATNIETCTGYSFSVTQTVGGRTSDFSECATLSELVVTTDASYGFGSLQWAIDCANDHIGYDLITFDIPGPGPHHINITNSTFEQATVNDSYTIIDATTQPGYTLGDITIRGAFNIRPTLTVLGNYCEIYGLTFSGHNRYLDLVGSDCIIGGPGKGNAFDHPSWASTNFHGINTTAEHGLIQHNIFHNLGTGIKITNSISLIEMTNNQFSCNEDAIEHYPNFGGDDPIISISDFTINKVTGFAYPGARVEVYAIDNTGCGDVECQGYELVGTTTATFGSWTLNGSFADISTVTAIAYSTDNGSSDFADCFTKNTCLEVSNTNTSGAGSLAAAIDCANVTTGSDEIYFNISGSGPFVIDMGGSNSLLPTLTDDGTTIDATTQPGWVPGYITVEGGAGSSSVGLNLTGDQCYVYGLRIFDFFSSGIFIGGQNCGVGSEFKANVIVGNGSGITYGSGASASAIYNHIGVEADETTANGNSSNGILFAGNNVFNYISKNIIANNGGFGIRVGSGTSQKVAIRQNSIYCNTSGGIQLLSGANNNIEAPVITGITSTSISGIVGNLSNYIDVYEVDSNCGTSTCQGKTFVNTILADSNGDWEITGSFDPGKTYTATTTDEGNNTSEFSACASNQPSCLIVTNTNDSGAGSLRDAISCANVNPLFDRITFDLPIGSDPYVINIQSTLPNLNGDIEIDATSQPAYYPGMIIVSGSSMSSGQYGMTMSGNNGSVYGLQMEDFPANAIRVYSSSSNVNIGKLNGGNIFCGNTTNDIQVYATTYINIDYNLFGVMPDGTMCTSTTNSAISATATNGSFSSNVFAHHNGGVFLSSGSQNISMSNNEFYCNTSYGIKFSNNSVNNGVQAPTITSADANEISGTAQAGEYIEVYYSDATCISNVCQGEESLGIIIANAMGEWTLNGDFDPTQEMTATATDVANNTSRFSNCYAIEEACTDYISVIQNPLPSSTYQAGITLNSQSTLDVNAVVEFKAGTSVVLEAGFNTANSQIFEALIEGCPN